MEGRGCYHGAAALMLPLPLRRRRRGCHRRPPGRPDVCRKSAARFMPAGEGSVAMLIFMVRRFGTMILTLLVVSVLVFSLLEINVHSVATQVLGPYSLKEQDGQSVGTGK